MPKGTSAYQAAWIFDDEDDDGMLDRDGDGYEDRNGDMHNDDQTDEQNEELTIHLSCMTRLRRQRRLSLILGEGARIET